MSAAAPAGPLEVERAAHRAALLLARPEAWLQSDAAGYRVRIGSDGRRRPVMRLDEAVFAQLTREPGLAVRPEGGWRLAHCRLAALPRFSPGAAKATSAPADPSGLEPARRPRPAAEDPLAWLARRKDADGRPLLTSVEVAAGEQLRADFERSGTLGRLTMAWEAGPRAKGGRGPPTDPLEHGRAARERVARALDAVGPELRAVLEQVCLRGAGLMEAERALRLPRRTGKSLLQRALQRLAAHYRIG